jgi:GxxExxY protein
MRTNDITGAILSAAMKVHSALGPGLLESAYRTCRCHELNRQGLQVRKELPLPVTYDGFRIDVGYRIDLLVEETVIVELKSASRFLPLHEAQLLSYLKLSHHRIGLLINFNVRHLRNGIRRLIN